MQETKEELTLEEKKLAGIDRFMAVNYKAKPLFTNWVDPNDFGRTFLKIYVGEDSEGKKTLYFFDYDDDRKDRYEFERALIKFSVTDGPKVQEAASDAGIQYGLIKYLLVDEEAGQAMLRAEFISWKE